MREMNYQTSTQQTKQTKQFRGGEKKVMKKRLALLLSVAMAFSMFANVAFGADAAKTTQEKFDALKTQGVFNGYPDGSAGLDKDMTRAEFAKVLVKLFGLKEIHGEYSYKDKNYGAKNWAAPFIEAVTKEGLMQGKDLEKKLFDFNGKITVEEAAKTLVNALKLEEVKDAQNNASSWAKGYFQAAVDAGLFSKDANPKANATRTQLVEAAYAADELTKGPKVVSYKVKDSKTVEFTMSDKEVATVTLEKALEANKETEVTFTYKDKAGKEFKITTKVTYTITSAQSIKSVTAENLKEVVVTFDGSLEQKTAENKNNYEVKDMKIESVTMAQDKNSVTILLEENGSDLKNQKETEVKIKNVKNEDGSKTFNETKKFTPVDVKTPEIKEVVGLGTKAFKIVFSEPVKRGDAVAASNYKVDGSSASGSVDYMYPNVVIVKKDLSVGTHKVSASNITDFSGLKSIPADKEFTIAEDTAAPEIVSAKTTDLNELELEFNETVRSIEKVYHNTSGNIGKITYKDNKVKVEFSNKMYNGDNTIYVKGATDYSGNKADREIKVNPTLDQTRPEIVKLEVKEVGALNNHQLVLEFNKKLDAATAKDNKNYTLKDKDGKVLDKFVGTDRNGHPVSRIDYNESNYKVTIDLNAQLSNETDYILEVTGVRDTAALQNTIMPYTQTFTAKQTATTGIVRSWIVEGNNEENLYVQFKEDVKTDGDGSALIKEKYVFNNNSITDHDISMMTGDTVRITAKAGKLGIKRTGENVLSVSQVANAKGDYIKQNGNYTLTYKGTLEDDFANSIKVNKVSAVSTKELKVEFGGKINYVVLSDFSVSTNYGTFTPNDYEKSNDGSVITLKFTDRNELPSSLSGAILKVAPNASTADVLNVRVKAGEYKVEDYGKVRPTAEVSSLNVKSVTDTTYLADIRVDTPLFVDTAKVNEVVKVYVNNKEAQVEKVFVEKGYEKLLQIQFKYAAVNDGDTVRVEVLEKENDVYKSIVDEKDHSVALDGFNTSLKFKK